MHNHYNKSIGMKKALTLFCLVITLALNSGAQSIYDIPLESINGEAVNLSNYKGRKVMFIILYANMNDSGKVNQLNAFAGKNGGKVQVIGIPPSDHGFVEGSEIERVYKKINGTNVKIIRPMKVKKSAGPGQSALTRWLTDRNFNRHFNQDVKAPGQKFFIDEKGELYAVLGDDISLTGGVIDRVVSRTEGH